MNKVTGEIKMMTLDELKEKKDSGEEWTELPPVGDVVTIRGLYFKVKQIDAVIGDITLHGISKREAKALGVTVY